MDEQVVRKAVATVDALEVDHADRLEVDRRIARLRVGHVPVAGRDLRQEGKDSVPEVTRLRDELPGLAGEEPVRLRVVALVRGDRADEHLEVVGIHLPVGGHDAGDVVFVRRRPAVASDDGCADALVLLVR